MEQHQDQRMKQLASPNPNPNPNHHNQPPPPQKCPRCESSNTKFCYYNNYSLSQPRYFCKACRRYWTHGGTLRNVPVGGGCRKSKRPKPSVASSSSGGGGSPSLPLAYPPQTLAGMNPGQGVGSLPSQVPPMGSTFYSGGSFLSTLAGMHPLPPGGAAANLGGGSSQYDASMSLLQGVTLPSLNNGYFPARPPLTWTQSFINRGPATTSAATSSGFWSGDASANQAGTSFNPNNWPENNNQGFDASQ
ncbi:hypothetical protein ACS0TY_031346 [Phlomoides rotata]